MPWGDKKPLPAPATQFENFMAAHGGGQAHTPTRAPRAWKHLTKALAYRLPGGMHRAEHARRRMLRAVR
jgi:hypothetical protein